MPDVMSIEQRRRCMSRIRGKNTGPEMHLRKALWAAGFRYRLKNSLPGSPDLVFVRERLVVFVDGCFWHACPNHFQWPKNNASFWREKIQGNVERDHRNNILLQEQGWRVCRIWEHEINNDINSVVQKVVDLLGTV